MQRDPIEGRTCPRSSWTCSSGFKVLRLAL
jgi:hypothetical protein